MNKKRLIIFSSLLAIGAIAVSIASVAFFTKKVFNVNADDVVDRGSLTFNSSHKTVITEFGNSVTSNGNGGASYLHSFSGDGYWTVTSPIQTVHSISVSYTTTSLGVLHNVYVGCSASSGGSGTRSESGTIIKSQATSGTYTFGINNANLHYPYVRFDSFDTSVPFYLTSVVIVYSCS